ncbi:diguanylate cyclase [Reinekea sp. G2M2-21]|uniref:diguanylate cyclase n=1 Tax=Reinekea sp. G2M2-21 TaxID=2788942 RepID=UPI0018A956B9|nr:diguanylate cyclase [Reinekea sp. G2M2-21]
MDTGQLLINVLLYLFLPLWGIAGFVDWCCHRATHIESTSGLTESLMHSVMGIQVGIPIILCLTYRVNVLILLLCLLAWALHEFIAHMDVHFASPRRKISIWEMHAHSYLATLPLYMLSIIAVINWPVVIDLVQFNWAGQLTLTRMEYAHGFDGYLPAYLIFMGIVCVFPYMEENLRCLRYRLKHKGVSA